MNWEKDDRLTPRTLFSLSKEEVVDTQEVTPGMPEEEPSLSNEVVEERRCDTCGWATTAKDYKRAIRRHSREEHSE